MLKVALKLNVLPRLSYLSRRHHRGTPRTRRRSRSATASRMTRTRPDTRGSDPCTVGRRPHMFCTAILPYT